MKANTPSRTAQYMALFRAIESARPEKKRLFTDKFAIHFLDNGLKTATRISAIPVIGSIIPKIIHHKALGAISSGIARTKYIDDLLYKTIQDGTKQVIILGAGFDTRGMRLDFLKDVSIIEIDHPFTSNFKLEKIKSFGKYNNIRHLQIDFNQQSLEELGIEQQIDFSIPTTIIWEGVTNYLTKGAIDHTFAFLEKFNNHSYIIFTYIHQQVLDNPQSFEGTDNYFKNLRENEEPWTFGFIPNELPHYLAQFNMKVIEDKGAAEYRAQYMPERTSLLNGYEFYRVTLTQITK